LRIIPAPGWFGVLDEDPSQDVFDEQFAPVVFAEIERVVPGFDPPVTVRSVEPLTIANGKPGFSFFAMEPGPDGFCDVRYYGLHGDPRCGDKPLNSLREALRHPSTDPE
jgi:hypothetical protein